MSSPSGVRFDFDDLRRASVSFGDVAGRDVHKHVHLGGALSTPPPPTYEPPPLPDPATLPAPGSLPPGSHLPFPRNACFTGREEVLKELARHLLYDGAAGGSPPPAVVVTGWGGVGKTQLAVEFCYRYGPFTQGVHWLDAGQDLTAQIADCGRAMGLPALAVLETPEEKAAYTLQVWQHHPHRLVVLDGLEEPEVLRAWLPRLGGVRLLVTARRRSWPPELGVVERPLATLDRSESLALLRRLAPRLAEEPDGALEPIAERLGDLPLALDLAGRYLEDRRTLSPGNYLEELKEAGGALAHTSLRDWAAESPTAHATSLAATFLLSWGRLEAGAEVDGLARRLFPACGYGRPGAPIPPELFHALAAEVGAGEVVADRAVRRLRELGLVGEEGEVHQLLAEFARGLAAEVEEGEEGRGEGLGVMARALARLAREVNEEVDRTGEYGRFAPLVPHLETVAGWAEGAGLEEAGSLWGNLGYHLHALADYRRARACYKRALRIGEDAFGSDHPEVALAANNLGSVLQDLGDWAGARACYERALRIDEAAFGPDHPNVATLLNNLGGVLQDLGDWAGARECLERALQIDEATFGPDHPNVARDVNSLGGVLKALGDLAGARECYERALRIDEAAFGPDHRNVTRDVNNLGLVLQALGDLAGARECLERALTIWEQALGPDHPHVASAVNNLGSVLQDLGDLAGARACYERALRIDEAAFGPDHPEVARDVNNLGSVLKALGDLAGARECYERALRIFERFLPPDHPHIRIVRENLDGLERGRGGVRGLLRKVWERLRRRREEAVGGEAPRDEALRR